MIPGLLLVNKPSGKTSFDVIQQIRKTLNTKKVGHAGTLDRFATGLVVVAVGEATKVLSELLLSDKTYIAELHFGITSDTDDSEGEKIIMPNIKKFSRSDLQSVLSKFLGKIQQMPPLYSALKSQGKRLSDRVRRGEDMQVIQQQKTREVEILSIEILEFAFPKVTIEVQCGSGTYVRSLARDLGKEMQTGAHLSALQRTQIWPFRIINAKSPDEIHREDVLPLQPIFFPFPSREISKQEAHDIRHGKSIFLKGVHSGKVSLFHERALVAFAEEEQGKIFPKRVFL